MERAMQDPDLSSLKSELSLMDARVGDLLAKLPEKHTTETWREVKLALVAIQTAIDNDGAEPEEIHALLGHVLDDLDLIRGDTQIWKEIQDTVAERRRLSVEERKRETALEGTVTAAQFDLVVGAMGLAVNEEVSEFEHLTPVQAEELVARIGARFAQTLRYPILEADTPIPDSILDVRNGRGGGIELDV